MKVKLSQTQRLVVEDDEGAYKVVFEYYNTDFVVVVRYYLGKFLARDIVNYQEAKKYYKKLLKNDWVVVDIIYN